MLKTLSFTLMLLCSTGAAWAQDASGTVVSGDSLDNFMQGGAGPSDSPAPVMPQVPHRAHHKVKILANRAPMLPPAAAVPTAMAPAPHPAVPLSYATNPGNFGGAPAVPFSAAAGPLQQPIQEPAPPSATPLSPSGVGAVQDGVENLSDEDASRSVVDAQRESRVLSARLQVMKLRADLKDAEEKIRKDEEALMPKPIMAPAPLPAVAKQPPKIEKSDAGSTSSFARFRTVSIAGVEENPRAILQVRGFGDVRVAKGDKLPDNFEVVGVSDRGVTVRHIAADAKDKDGPVMLVPFYTGGH